MLTCFMCGETKPEADFAFADKTKGIRQRHCRKCHAAYRRAHYLANRDDYIRREVARMAAYRDENRLLLLAYLASHPCVDCGETDPVVLDFDHRDPSQKRSEVGRLASHKPWADVLAEIAKCDVRCANCHRKRTAQQFGWGKLARVASEQPPMVQTIAPVTENLELLPLTSVSRRDGVVRAARQSRRINSQLKTRAAAYALRSVEHVSARTHASTTVAIVKPT